MVLFALEFIEDTNKGPAPACYKFDYFFYLLSLILSCKALL